MVAAACRVNLESGQVPNRHCPPVGRENCPRRRAPEAVAARIRRGLDHVAAERLIPAPDCGMKYLPREIAFGKLKAMVEGAAIVRRELSGE